jgi:hypothetical protein
VSLTPLEKAHETMRARREAGETIVRLDPMEKAKSKPKSLRLAVSAKCADCVGWHGDPGARGRIRDCTVYKCPLHNVRPYQKGSAEEGELDEGETSDASEAPAPPGAVTLKGSIRDGLALLVLLEDDRAFRSPEYATEEAAEESLALLPPGRQINGARLDDWTEVFE